LASLRGRVDSLESRVSDLEASQFSTTTKLRGQTTFLLGGNGGASDSVGTSPFNDRPRLNFDTSFTGKDLLNIRLSNSTGFGTNVNEEIGYWSSDSYFTGLTAEFLYKSKPDGAFNYYYGGSLGGYYFEHDIETRQDGDQELHDIDLYGGFSLDLGNGFKFTTRDSLTHSDFGGFGRTLRQGVLDDTLTRVNSDNFLNYKIGRFGATTRFRFGHLNESGGDYFNFKDYLFSQELSLPLRDRGPVFYLNGGFGSREYGYNPWGLSSDHYQFNAGARGFLPFGPFYDVSLGYESRDYENSSIGTKENLRIQTSVSGSPSKDLKLDFQLSYGTQELFPNFAGASMADPLGWLIMLNLQRSFGSNGDLGFFAQATALESQFDSTEFNRNSLGIYYDIPANKFCSALEGVTITPSLIYTHLDTNSGQSDDSVIGAIRTSLQF